MEQMIAFCGIDCNKCDALHAARENDDKKRAEVAALWSKEYKTDLKPEDINCFGCTSEGDTLFGHCQVCEIRACAKERNVETCAHCGDYACEKLAAFFKMAPFVKDNLDAIRSTL